MRRVAGSFPLGSGRSEVVLPTKCAGYGKVKWSKIRARAKVVVKAVWLFTRLEVGGVPA